MKDKEILERAISKAIEGGWNPHKFIPITKLYSITEFLKDSMVLNIGYDIKGKELRDRWHVQTVWLLFNHEFAKALWGKEWMIPDWFTNRHKEYSRGDVLQSWQMGPTPWQYHLQRMVISDDPVKYLGDNI